MDASIAPGTAGDTDTKPKGSRHRTNDTGFLAVLCCAGDDDETPDLSAVAAFC